MRKVEKRHRKRVRDRKQKKTKKLTEWRGGAQWWSDKNPIYT